LHDRVGHDPRQQEIRVFETNVKLENLLDSHEGQYKKNAGRQQ